MNKIENTLEKDFYNDYIRILVDVGRRVGMGTYV